jgi:hypothetical protein
MTADDRLLYEARMRMRWAIVAGGAAALLLIGGAIALSGPQTSVNEETLGLIFIHKRSPIDLIAATINAFGVFAFGAILYYLSASTRARRPETNPLTAVLGLVGAAIGGVSGIVLALVLDVKAAHFVSNGGQTFQEAHNVWTNSIVVGSRYVGLLGTLLLAVAIVMVSLAAMRVGLLTRFMGYLGIFVAVLQMGFIPTPIPVVQCFWLFGLAYLVSGRWPAGIPPAWRTGQAVPWPTSAELRQQREKQSGRGKPAAKPPPEPVASAATRGTRATTPKRKRKRRR